MPRGLFITFDGGEGGGKTTLCARLADWLREQGQDVVLTREPGGTAGAQEIRSLLVTGEPDRWLPISEIMLYAAARHDNCKRVIEPALQAGTTVLCDRFNESTIAYQGYGHGQNIDDIRSILNIATSELEPDLTFIMDLPAELAIQRSRGASVAEDRFEKIPIDFHQRLRNGYLELARQSPNRCNVIDATQPLDKVFKDIIAVVQAKLKQAP